MNEQARDGAAPPAWAKGGEPLPGFRLVEERPFAKGGSGEVWRAEAPGGFRHVLKRVPLDGGLAAHEEQAMSLLPALSQHDRLLRVLAVQRVGGALAIAMEEAQGSLEGRLAARGGAGLPPAELLPFLRDAAEGIDYLHQQGIEHRDIKPDNLLLVGGRVKVGDFGLAKVMERTRQSHSGPMTPAYAAPEWFAGHSAPQSDQYSLAVTYVRLRTGRPPVRPPDVSGLLPAEAKAVQRALSERPADRWPSCLAFSEAVQASFETTPSPTLKPAEPALKPAEPVPTRKSLLVLFGQLNPRSRLNRVLGLVEMPLDDRPSENISYGERVDKVLDWADARPGGFVRLDAVLRELLAEQQQRP